MPNPHKPNMETEKKHIFGGQANKYNERRADDN